MALGLAVNARGADHNRSGAYEADFSGELDRLAGGEAHARAAIETEDRAAVMDSLILCKFLRGVFADPFDRVGGAAARGHRLGRRPPPSCERTARRIVLAKRLFNLREGWTRADDWLPQRFLSEPLEVGSGRAAALTPERLRRDDRRLLRGGAVSTRDGIPRRRAAARRSGWRRIKSWPSRSSRSPPSS